MIFLFNAIQNIIALNPVCLQPKPAFGIACKASFERYYYDASQNMCLKFIYGGLFWLNILEKF